MKIVKLEVENVKRVVKVDITPGGLMVLITGPNGAGKSSVLDAIWWALAGERSHQSAPIRKGAEAARVSLDLGDVAVTREWARKDDDATTTRLLVENADGSRFTSPQKMLDSLLGSLTFDPLAFCRASDREQVEKLSGLCGIDMAAVEREHKTDFDARREHNRTAKARRAAADAISVPAETPDDPVSVGTIVQRIRDTELLNRELETERGRREGARLNMDSRALSAERLIERAVEEVRRAAEQAADLLRRAETVRVDADSRATEFRRQAAEATALADKAGAELAALPPLDADTDTAEMQEQVTAAEQTNDHVRANRRKRELMDEHRAASDRSAALTAGMALRREKARAAIASANLGIDGLTVEDGRVMLGDHPFDQASDAERLRASCAIAMRGDAKLRVLRVRDGSLLDEDSLRLLSEMAEAEDWQCWVERVATSGKVGIVIEDGKVKR